MKNKLAIGIPTINRYDLLKEALQRYFIDFPNIKIFIIDNGKQNIVEVNKNLNVYVPKTNLGVAASWNKLCNIIFEEHDYALILNDDIILGKTEKEIDELLSKEIYDFYVGSFYWSAFILPKRTFDKIGDFDEYFYPAFYEDNDYDYRRILCNCSRLTTDVLLPTVARNSMTIKKDASLNQSFEDLKQFYKKKWGGEPGEEKFITHFNMNLKV